MKYINEIKLRDFQFKINNKILVTNSFLYKINKIDNYLCSYCQKETESILYLLFGCDVVKEFWGSFKTWVMGKINTDVHLSTLQGIEETELAGRSLQFPGLHLR